MDVGVSRLMYEANVGDPPKLIVEFVFGGPFADTAHKAAAINSWFTHGGPLDINYDGDNDAIILTKKKY